MSDEKVRYNLYLSQDVANQFNDFADVNGLNRSAAFTLIVREYMSYKRFMDSFPDLVKALENQSNE